MNALATKQTTKQLAIELGKMSGDDMETFITRLGTDYASIETAINSSDRGDKTKVQYIRTLNSLRDPNGDPAVNLFDYSEVQGTLAGMSDSRKRYLSTIIRQHVQTAKAKLQSMTRPENYLIVASITNRLSALDAPIKVKQSKGQKTHTWLTSTELVSICQAINTDSLKGKRDLLTVLLCGDCGLRRDEAANLKYSDVVKTGDNYVLSILGKGEKLRTVPLAKHTKRLIDEIQSEAAGRKVLKRFDRHGNVKDGLSGHGIADIVKSHGQAAGYPALMPHDLRRTFAMIRFDSKVPVAEISKLLGHASIATTERYLNVGVTELIGREFISLG
jgi:integrase